MNRVFNCQGDNTFSKTSSMVSSQSTVRSSFNSLVIDQFGYRGSQDSDDHPFVSSADDADAVDTVDIVALAGDSLGLSAHSHGSKVYPSPFQTNRKLGLGGLPIQPRNAPQTNLTYYHKTNETVLRNNKNEICAVIRVDSTDNTKKSSIWSTKQQQRFTIYGCTPMHPEQQEENGIASTAADDGMKLYQWAAVQAKREKDSRSFLSSSKLRLCVEYANGVSVIIAKDLARFPRKEWMVEIQEDSKVGRRETSTTLSAHDSSNNADYSSRSPHSIHPGMDPKECISFLTSSKEFVEYVCCHNR